MKKIIIFCFLIVLNSCGYNSIYNIDKSKISIVDVSYQGDEFINNRISKSINNYKYTGDEESRKYNLEIYSKKEKKITAKDSEGNPKVFSLSITLKIVFENQDGEKITKNFNEDFTYNTMSNKFKLKQYEKNILNDIIFELIQEIIFSIESL